jgi:osmoprotectant transport system substrate-binding protein
VRPHQEPLEGGWHVGNRRSMAFVAALALIVSIGACSSGSSSSRSTSSNALNDDVITVGSFEYAESELLAEIYSQALERGGYEVRRAFDLGPREFVAPALVRGLIELVPEYAGSALLFFGVGSETPTRDASSTHEALARVLEPQHLVALAAAPAQDANTFAVTQQTAARHSLDALSDLAEVAPRLVFGGPPECPTRPLCLKGLEGVYRTSFKNVVSYLDAGGPVTHQALREGDIDVGLIFSTDATAADEGLVTLHDDRGLQPAENVTPVVRTEVLNREGPKLADLVDEVSARLTTDGLRELNAELSRGRSSRAVATAWLEAAGQP